MDFNRRRSSSGGTDAAAVAVAGLPDWARRLVQQTFGHYAALSDPLNRTTLSSGKFGRFLRDIGLVSSSEAHQGANGRDRRPSTASSAGTNRRRSATDSFSRRSTSSFSRSTSPGNGRAMRSGSVGAVPAFQPRRSSVPVAAVAPGTGEMPTQQSGARLSVSRSKTLSQVGGGDAGGNGAGQGLPLQVFPMTSVSQAESDLIFMQAVGRNGRSSTKSMSADAFLRALADLAARCQASEGVDMPVNQALEEFCSRVLAPLAELLPEVSGYDLPMVDRLFNEPDTQSTFEHYQVGLDKIFSAYGVEKAGQRAFWTQDSILRFAKDFELAEEVGHLPLRRLFKDCVHYAHCGGNTKNDEEMQLPCYRLALAMLSQRVHSTPEAASPPEKLAAFLQRLSSVATSKFFSSRYGHAGRTAALQPTAG